jgi:hypothetical protein
MLTGKKRTLAKTPSRKGKERQLPLGNLPVNSHADIESEIINRPSFFAPWRLGERQSLFGAASC